MTDYHITGNDCQHSTNQSLFGSIVFGRSEEYDAAKLNCWAFCKSSDVREGIPLSLGNLCKGFPFKLNGHLFNSSEAAYLCGEFSSDSALCASVQRSLIEEANPFLAKKVIKRRNIEYIRTDWEEVRLQWMLYVVWQKCVGNANFRQLLLSLPTDAVIIEDSTTNHGATSFIWGAKNKELGRVRRTKKKELYERYSTTMKKKDLNALISHACIEITNIGRFVGENNMGKVLMLCKIALHNKVVPPIDYALLRTKKIYIFGELLTFNKEETVW